MYAQKCEQSWSAWASEELTDCVDNCNNGKNNCFESNAASGNKVDKFSLLTK